LADSKIHITFAIDIYQLNDIMKRLLIIICLFSSMLLNAQVINWNKFDEKILNGQVFIRMSDYTQNNGHYSISPSFSKQRRIHSCIVNNNARFSANEVSAKINHKIPKNYVGILDVISCKDIKDFDITYQDIANRCIIDWILSPSDSFFMIGSGNEVVTTSYYNKKTETVYISVVFIQ